jgi:hypothetical protein
LPSFFYKKHLFLQIQSQLSDLGTNTKEIRQIPLGKRRAIDSLDIPFGTISNTEKENKSDKEKQSAYNILSIKILTICSAFNDSVLKIM